MFTTAIKGVLAHKLRLALTAMAIVLSVSFVAGTYIFADTINARFDTLFADVYAGIDVSVDPAQSDLEPGPGTLPAGLLETVSTVDGVEDAVGQVDGYAQILDDDGNPVGGQGPPTYGMSWVEQPGLSALRIADGNGRAPTAAGEVVIDVATAEAVGFVVGDQVDIQFAGSTEDFEVVGLASFGNEDSLAGATLAVFELGEAQRVLDLDSTFSSIVLKAADGIASDELKQRISQVLPNGAEASTGAEQTQRELDEVSEGLGFLTTALLAFAAVAVFVGAFIIQNTFRIVVAQRTRELALLRAIGATGRQVVVMVGLEALIVGVAASGVGVAAGLGLSYVLRVGMNAAGMAIPAGPLTVLPRTILVAMTVGVVVTLASALMPALKAARVPPVAAMSETTAIDTVRSLRRRAMTGALLASVGAALLAAGLFANLSKGMLYVGVGAAAMFIGVATLAPLAARPMADVLGWPLVRFFGISGKLAKENTKRKPRRTASTASALMIGVALMTFVSIFASTIKTSVEATMTEAFPSDLTFVQAEFGDPDQNGFTSSFADELEALPEIETVSAIRFGMAKIDGEVEGLAAVDPDTISSLYRLDAPHLGLEAALDGELLVAEEKLVEKGWAVGETINIEFAETGHQEITIGGTFSGQNLGPYLVARSTYDLNYSTDLDGFVLASYADGADESSGRTAVDALVADYPAVALQDQDQAVAEAAKSTNQLLALFWGLLGMAVLIAVMGIANTLALSIAERTREVGLLRAVGMSRRQVRSMIRWEAVIISLFGAVLGISLGVFFGWSITRALAEQGLARISIPVSQLTTYLVLATLAGLAAAAWPARSAARMNVLNAISYE